MARTAVEEELKGEPAITEAGHNGSAGNGHPNGHRDRTRKATASQVRALNAIADRFNIELAAKLRADYGVDQPGELSVAYAEAGRFANAGTEVAPLPYCARRTRIADVGR